MRRNNAGLVRGAQHHGAGAVAEQHAGTAVGPVDDARQGFGANHERAACRAGANEFLGDRQGVDKTGAHRLHVARRAATSAMLPVVSSAAAIWRSRMPVRSTIHSLVVSTIFSRSALVRIFFGRLLPAPR